MIGVLDELERGLICGTNRDLHAAVREGRFREDPLARIHLWTFVLPGLRERPEDLEPNLQYELDQYTARTGTRVTFNREARARFLDFALSPSASWKGNFRDLNAAVARMATLSSGGRITVELVEEEIKRLAYSWGDDGIGSASRDLRGLLTEEQIAAIDHFDRVQLEQVVAACRRCRSLSEAGRLLFNNSRTRKASANDADRLRKYLSRFELTWDRITQAE